VHHAGDFKSGNGWLAHGKKHSLNLRGELDILKKVVSLLLYRFGEQFPLLYVSLDDVNDKGEAQQCQQIIEDSEPWMDNPRRPKVMEQYTNWYQAIGDFLA
jgi:hypothetical protein